MARYGLRNYPYSYRFLWILLVPLINLYWRIRKEGRRNLPKDTGFILASNHWSGVDPIMVCSSFWRPVHWLAKLELVVTKKYAWFFKAAAVIPVDRDAPQQTSIDKAGAVIRSGGLFGIYPEGTRSRDGRLYKGFTGVARIAAASGAPVVPTGVLGTRESVPKGKLMPRPVKVTVRFGEPLNFAMRAGEDEKVAYRRFTDEVMEAIARLTGQRLAHEYNRRDGARSPD